MMSSCDDFFNLIMLTLYRIHQLMNYNNHSERVSFIVKMTSSQIDNNQKKSLISPPQKKNTEHLTLR